MPSEIIKDEGNSDFYRDFWYMQCLTTDEAGWNFDDLSNHWDWFGLPGDSVDYNFGFYGTRTQQWDQIAFSAPYYLIVESAGNSHSETGPPVGSDYYGYVSASNQTFVDKGPRP